MLRKCKILLDNVIKIKYNVSAWGCIKEQERKAAYGSVKSASGDDV
ncbi:hypothetical protein BRYFOR_08703 [Marvinbryantia formatexigens DSM 14469]|uniref:Uncharacterized protein n=1 Tax=Marvinbryantia formatexigens DSM 14469 TaxID=478749 RepID=C6LJ69_9FIRM|nr:hypothetical protein BRYFOR_08703 [Marvinbryantia formatexigens DSM 14469]